MHPRHESKSRLSYWFPLIEAAGLPVPRTAIVRATGDLDAFHDGGSPACLPRLLADIRAAAGPIGVPFFLRTDFTSGKHEWTDTCFVSVESCLARHVYGVWEYSEMADMIGLPTDVWVVREMLDTRPRFRAFRGMPIVEEFRFFVRDGQIEHVQGYWPPDAIRRADAPDYREIVAGMNRLDDADRAAMTELTKRASAAAPGFWSVDWLRTADRGWVLTDMAEGDQSFRWGESL